MGVGAEEANAKASALVRWLSSCFSEIARAEVAIYSQMA